MNRREAISLVEAALASGRIVQADHDMRLDQIKNASTDQDVEIVVRDLQTPVPAGAAAAPPVVTVGSSPAQTGQPWPLVNYGPGQGQPPAELVAMTKSGGKWLGGIIGLVVLLVVLVPIIGVVIAVVSAKDTFDDFEFATPQDETTYLPGQEPGEDGVNVHTLDGFEEMLAALRAETGSLEVDDAVLYPRYAVISVFESPKGRRVGNYYWDGRTMVRQDYKSTSDSPRIDLDEFDPAVVLTLLEDVRARVEDPNSWYAILGSDSIAGTPQISVYASNEYGEGAYLLATADGTVTYENTYD